MELNNEFRVAVPVSDAWKVLTDVERIAPMLPGAQLQEVEGEEYRGVVKVKVGPITAQYKGKAHFVERDEKAGKVVLRAQGRDTRGQGNANATITALMHPESGKERATKVSVTTDLTVTGKVAQFGRGVLADVSTKLIGQFVDSLEKDLAEHGAGEGEAATTAGPDAEAPPAAEEKPGVEPRPAAKPTSGNGAGPKGDGAVGQGGSGTDTGADRAAGAEAGSRTTTAPAWAPAAAPATSPAGPRTINSPDAEPVDLVDAAGASIAKRLLPLVGAVAAVVLVAIIRRQRRG